MYHPTDRFGKYLVPQLLLPLCKKLVEQEYNTIKYYDIDPFDADAQVDWSQFSFSDLVVVNNYWGLKENKIPTGKRPLIIEDHSHGWLSKGCLESKADFCIASLRKTLPVPLAGIVWKPKKGSCEIPLPSLKKINSFQDINPMIKSWELIDIAMEKKAICRHPNEKTEFLTAYSQGEMLLSNTQEIFSLQKKHESIIREYLFKNFNSYKKNNFTFIIGKLKPSKLFKVIFPKNHVPFGLLLAFKDRGALNNFKQFLIANTIYPAELWPQNQLSQEYKFLLNVHLDYRYNEEDLLYMAKIINQWSLQQSNTDGPESSKFNVNLSK